jgi:hypothetical protein
MKAIFSGWFGSSLVCDVAGVAAHVKRGVPAAFLRHIHSGFVAAQAEILLLVAGHWLQQLVLVIGSVRIVAL